MRLEETFEFDAAAYAIKVQAYSDSNLRAQETRKGRQIINSTADAGSAYASAAFDPTIVTALTAGAVSSREAEVAEAKLGILKQELLRRGLRPRELNDNDYSAAALSSVAGDIGDDLGSDEAESLGDTAAEANFLGNHVGDAAEDATAEALLPKASSSAGMNSSQVSPTYQPPSHPPPGYSAPQLQPNCQRRQLPNCLQCSACRRFFDPRFETFLHCCLCQDKFDVCGRCRSRGITTCAPPGNHVLSTVQNPNVPKVNDSDRALWGSMKCDACRSKIKKSHFYGCEKCYDSLDEYDVCLSCFEVGKRCPKHGVEPMVRKSSP